MTIELSWDELFQIFLFLPVIDVNHFSQTRSTTHECIISNQHLWAVLFKRDFSEILRQCQQQGLNEEQLCMTDMLRRKDCCDEMKNYVLHYLHYFMFPFYRVDSQTVNDKEKNHISSKILFGVCNSPLNQIVIDVLRHKQLVIQDNAAYKRTIVVDFDLLFLASRQPKITPNFTIQLWMMGQEPEQFPNMYSTFFRGTQCLVITVDTRHSLMDEDTYSTTPSHKSYSNSLSRALVTLIRGLPLLNLEPTVCRGALIVGLGSWSEEALISKERFLNDCAHVFDALPLEYIELTCDNAPVMSDVILRRFYTFHDLQAAQDNAMLISNQPKEPEAARNTKCILS